MNNDSEFKKLEAEIEKERESIASLHDRVNGLVQRRNDNTSTAKPQDVCELQRKIDTMKDERPECASGL
jgi:hypothetical protein